jgi:hypothetical protein
MTIKFVPKRATGASSVDPGVVRISKNGFITIGKDVAQGAGFNNYNHVEIGIDTNEKGAQFIHFIPGLTGWKFRRPQGSHKNFWFEGKSAIEWFEKEHGVCLRGKEYRPAVVKNNRLIFAVGREIKSQ